MRPVNKHVALFASTSPSGGTVQPTRVVQYVAATFCEEQGMQKPGPEPGPEPGPAGQPQLCSLHRSRIVPPVPSTTGRRALLPKRAIKEIKAGGEQPAFEQETVCHRASRSCQEGEVIMTGAASRHGGGDGTEGGGELTLRQREERDTLQ